MNPNHYLSVAIQWLFSHRGDWPPQAIIGKTLVSSGMIDRVATDLGRPLREVQAGFGKRADGRRVALERGDERGGPPLGRERVGDPALPEAPFLAEELHHARLAPATCYV